MNNIDSMKKYTSRAKAQAEKALHVVKKKSPKHWVHWLYAIGGVILLGVSLVILFVATTPLPSLETLHERKIINSTKIYDRTGTIALYDIHNDVTRTIVGADEIAPVMKEAIVAIEDKDFYHHHGVVLRSTLRAIIMSGLHKLGLPTKTSGGSTITQQVIKNTLLTQDKSIVRKAKEIILALKLDRTYSKDEILALYLNEAPYGGTLYGIEDASLIFLGKHASELDLAEAAYLAAIPNAPTLYSPFGKNRKRLDDRKNLVLKNMLEEGMITREEYDTARVEEVSFLATSNNHGAKALHFVEYVKSILADKYGEDVLETGGLKVTTSLDWELEQKAEQIVKEQALKNEEQWNASNQALVAVDPMNGQILSMVGSRDYFDKNIDGNFNVALATRQPGSAFKPFVYSRAFELGFEPETVLFDVKTQFNPSCGAFNFTSQNNCYSPDNYDGKYLGPISLRNALAQSRNIPAVQLLYLVGLPDALRTAKSLGITTLDKNADRYGLTMVLGGGEVSLLDMVSSYGVFANDGIRVEPNPILKVEDSSGNVLYEANPSPVRVMNAEATRKLNSVLSDNDARTPLFGSRSFLYFSNRQVAGKTGTTNDNRDAWLIGYTPQIVVGVWSGNNDNSPMKKGSAISGPAWRAYMDEALKKLPVVAFPEPAPIDTPETIKPVLRGLWWGNTSYVVDTISGGLATEYTPSETKKEYVIPSPHSILQWVEPGNPLGPVPSDPTKTSQYKNWEAVVQSWISSHAGTIPVPPPKPATSDTVHVPGAEPVVNIVSPTTGSISLGTPTILEASVTGIRPITSVQFYLGSTLVGTTGVSPYRIMVTPADFGLESGTYPLRVIATDNVSSKGSATASLYIE